MMHHTGTWSLGWTRRKRSGKASSLLIAQMLRAQEPRESEDADVSLETQTLIRNEDDSRSGGLARTMK